MNDSISQRTGREEGHVVFSQRAPIGYATEVPKNLVQNPPKWARSLLERGTTISELVEAIGDAARAGYSRAQLRRVLNVVEQLALMDDVRQTIDIKLSPNFIPWLTTVALPQRSLYLYSRNRRLRQSQRRLACGLVESLARRNGLASGRLTASATRSSHLGCLGRQHPAVRRVVFV